MKNLRKIICLAVSLTLCAGVATSLAACGDNNGGKNDNDADKDTTVTVTDQAGREVTIESDPQNIVSGYYISTSMLIALGEKDNLKGIESKATTRAIYDKVGINAKDYKADGTGGIGGFGTKKALDTELALTVNCDLAVIPYSLKDKADSYSESLGAPVIVVNPESDTLMREALTILGKATGNDTKAKQLTDYIDASVSDMKTKIATTSGPSIYFAATDGILSTAGSDVYQNTLITNALATNVASSVTAAKGDTFATVDYEQIITWNPEVIVIAAEADLTVDQVKADANLASVSAVQNNKIYKMPSTYEAWDSPVPAAFLGSLWIAAQCYDGYSMDDFNAKLTEYYSTFYGITTSTNS
jgi:iron complex transport system substrate-binding protein